MDLIRESVSKIREILESNGCGEGDVLFDVNPDAENCQFEKGSCMTASFGGRSADFVTFDPIRALTKISFMFDAPLDTPASRGAAAAIVNAVTGFFCLSRVLHACHSSCHATCCRELEEFIGGKRVFCVGGLPQIERCRAIVVPDPETAEYILVGVDGITAQGIGDFIGQSDQKIPVLCVGPSVAGVARLTLLKHWCPYGKSS